MARPHSQSITAFGACASLGPPIVGQPCEKPVPGEQLCTTAKPRGSHFCTSLWLIMPGFLPKPIGAIAGRGCGGWPSSCSMLQ